VSGLTHLDEQGRARMVDVGDKPITARRAVARAVVRMAPATAATVAAGDAPKGDVLGTARIAGIQAAKRTGELIPLCHPLPLDQVDVRAEVDPAAGEVVLTAEARVSARTGVEMEALTAAAVAALTVYDMVKGLERGVEIAAVHLLEKSGGRSGEWRRSAPDAA
jgi:cyclic pyranopterin monophosphate synthase